MGFEGGMQKNWLLRGAIYTKKTREKERGHVKYLRKTLKSHNILIQKCFTTNLVDRITIYHKFSFCFNITLDIVFNLLPLSFI